MQGIVTRTTGSWYEVVSNDTGELWQCRLKGKLRLDDLLTTNPIAVGDIVEVEPEKNQALQGMITQVRPRKNYVIRQSTRQRNHLHLIAANIDQAILIVSIRFPNLKPGFIDRFLLTTTSYNIPTYILVNKADRYDEVDLEMVEAVASIYEPLGYPTILVSANTGQNLDKVKDILKDKTTLISGHSGVGKSSLINAIQPQLDLRTQEVSESTEKGQHTTTSSEMFKLDFGGNIIDTPGIKELGFIHFTPQDVMHNFKEIFAVGQQCKYNNCFHINEPHCAVKKAVEASEISELRYQNYLTILAEVQQQNNWELKTDW